MFLRFSRPLLFVGKRFTKRHLATNPNFRVGIIGAGVSGLQVAKTLVGYGVECRVFDKAPSIGGLWQSNYSGFGLQAPKQLYEFCDFPSNFPDGYYPKGEEVQSYIESYAAVHDLKKHVKLRTTVENVIAIGGGEKGWIIKYKDSRGNSQEDSFDYVVVATGMYSLPNMPKFEGQDKFVGEIVHSSKFTDNETATDKHVVVVGGAKSAIDVAIEASKLAERTTLLYRNAHWGTPRYIAGLIPFQYVFLSRLGQALVSWYKGAWPGSPHQSLIDHSPQRYFMGPVFRIVEAIFAFQLGQYGEYRPKYDVVKDFYGYAQVHDSSCFREEFESKRLKRIHGEIASLKEKSVLLKSGLEIPCDMLIYGTGYKKSYKYFDEGTQKALQVENDGLYLYRHMIPVDVPNLAFVGSEVATISNIMTYGIQAEYVARLILKKVTLPSKAQMAAAIEEMKKWKRSWMPDIPSRANLVLYHQIHYHDTLLVDMGVDHKRKGMNKVAELLVPYQSGDYDGIMNSLKIEK